MTRLEQAEVRAAAARTRLYGTFGSLQAKAAPSSLARSAADSGGRALAAGVETVRANPGKLVGALALVGAIVGRRQIAALVRKATDEHETASRATRSSRRTKD